MSILGEKKTLLPDINPQLAYDAKQRRKLRNQKIKEFLTNLTDIDKENSKIPFHLLMGNFRRKKMLDTLKDKTMSHTAKLDMLSPFRELIGSTTNEESDFTPTLTLQ